MSITYVKEYRDFPCTYPQKCAVWTGESCSSTTITPIEFGPEKYTSCPYYLISENREQWEQYASIILTLLQVREEVKNPTPATSDAIVVAEWFRNWYQARELKSKGD